MNRGQYVGTGLGQVGIHAAHLEQASHGGSGP